MKPRTDVADLQLFAALIEAGSFNAAARKLNVQTSTLTRRITELEERLGVKLLERSSKGVTATRAGMQLRDQVLTINRIHASVEQAATAAATLPAGDVHISAPDGLAGVLVAPHIPEFLQGFPQINLRFFHEATVDPDVHGPMDIRLSFKTPPAEPDLVTTTIAHFHYGLFASPRYLSIYGRPTSLQDAARHAYIHHVGQGEQKAAWHPRASGFQEVVIRRLETDISALSFAAIRAGAGIGALPSAILSIAPELELVPTPPMVPIKLMLTFDRVGGQSARVRCVIDWLKRVFDPRTQPWYREDLVHPDDFRHLLPPVETPAPPRQRDVG